MFLHTPHDLVNINYVCLNCSVLSNKLIKKFGKDFDIYMYIELYFHLYRICNYYDIIIVFKLKIAIEIHFVVLIFSCTLRDTTDVQHF